MVEARRFDESAVEGYSETSDPIPPTWLYGSSSKHRGSAAAPRNDLAGLDRRVVRALQGL